MLPAAQSAGKTVRQSEIASEKKDRVTAEGQSDRIKNKGYGPAADATRRRLGVGFRGRRNRSVIVRSRKEATLRIGKRVIGRTCRESRAR